METSRNSTGTPSATPATHIQRIAVTIPHWNGEDRLRSCLLAMRAQTRKPDVIIVLDNGSTDGSVTMLREEFPEVDCIALPENTGFAVGQNIPITKAIETHHVDAVLPLNNDVIAEPEYIAELVACLERHPNAAAIQGKIFTDTTRSVIECAGIVTHADWSAFQRGQDTEVDKKSSGGNEPFMVEEEILGAGASAALYTTRALTAVAGRTRGTAVDVDGNTYAYNDYFATPFFAYYEDVDMMWRFQLLGFSAWYTPTAIAYHARSSTGGTGSAFKSFHMHRNHYYALLRTAPLPFLLWALPLIPFRYVLFAVSRLRGTGSGARAVNTQSAPSGTGFRDSIVGIVLRVWCDILRTLPARLRERHFIQSQRRISWFAVFRLLRTYRATWRDIFFT